MNMWDAGIVGMYLCLLPLNALMKYPPCMLVCLMHLTMHYVKIFNLSIDICPCSWGCLPICLALVASSSPVGGSGMLQSGIRAHVVAWA